MRYCEFCGAPLDDDALFCTNCGARLSPFQPAPPDSFSAPKNDNIEHPVEKQDKDNRINTVLVYIAAFTILGAGLWYGYKFVTSDSYYTKTTTVENGIIVQQTTRTNTGKWDGHYEYEGHIAEKWHFDLQLNISRNEVKGQYRVHETNNGYVTLEGSIDDSGNISFSEYYDDGSPTGYYFTGMFSTMSISGKYLCTQRKINMKFQANKAN